MWFVPYLACWNCGPGRNDKLEVLEDYLVECPVCFCEVDGSSFLCWSEWGGAWGRDFEAFAVDMDELRKKWARENRRVSEKKIGVRAALEVGFVGEGGLLQKEEKDVHKGE